MQPIAPSCRRWWTRYGPDYAAQTDVTHQLREVFENTPDIVDVDESVEALGPRWIVQGDRQRAAYFGIVQGQAVSAVSVPRALLHHGALTRTVH